MKIKFYLYHERHLEPGVWGFVRAFDTRQEAMDAAAVHAKQTGWKTHKIEEVYVFS